MERCRLVEIFNKKIALAAFVPEKSSEIGKAQRKFMTSSFASVIS